MWLCLCIYKGTYAFVQIFVLTYTYTDVDMLQRGSKWRPTQVNAYFTYMGMLSSNLVVYLYIYMHDRSTIDTSLCTYIQTCAKI